MQLTEAQSRQLLADRGVFLNEACDTCAKPIGLTELDGVLCGPYRFTRFGDPRVHCSRLCRDGVDRKPGHCTGCKVALTGHRKGSKWCGEGCRKRTVRESGQDRPNNPDTAIENTPLTAAQMPLGYIPTSGVAQPPQIGA